jgi:hypothetical protein
MKIIGKINRCFFGHKFNVYTKTNSIVAPNGKTSKVVLTYRRCTVCGLFQRKSYAPIFKDVRKKWITIEKKWTDTST